ncbi:hypothetical protein ULMS_17010 [Patiriisocius marinistellae]|uniref:RNA polymerase sigma-70 region 2 domain-containing protein n=1 Tax=Patiriisocius marinistellae TaxID=2494560 RepID=A0A5J4FW79_9FLAO|nr:sigma-70 family RNA polymerase sigma factor [Patiriisocius marinistellae]GEQ86193.1 hypothetical protein ULMS_17010 [Patiriisocius marinistellae]
MKNNLTYLNALLTNNSVIIKKLYKENFPAVRKFVIQNKGQEADAEDVFQKAIVQISVRYRKEKFEINSSFEAYLFTACKNLWRRELNKSKRRVTSLHAFEQPNEEQDQALALLEQKRWELFNESLKSISENCQEVLKLFFTKTAYSIIVEKLGYNSETVARQRVFKCKKKLSQIIKNDPRFKMLKQL